MTTFIRRRLLGLSCLLSLTLAAGLAQAQPKPMPITVSYTATPEFGAIFIAKEEGFFARRGLDVTLQLIPVSPNVPAAVMSKSVQIGGTTPPVLLQAIDSGLDLVAVAGGGVYEKSSRGVGLVARNGVTVNAPADLVGKKVGVPGFNATIHLLVRKWLMDHGVDPKKVTFVEVAIPQMPDVLKGGSVDVVATAEPFVGRIVQGQIGTAVPAFSNDLANGFSSVLYVSTRQWAVANPEIVKAFRDALQEAVSFGNANKDKGYEDIGKYFKVPPPVLRATPWPNWVATLKDDHLRFWVDTMRSQDMLKKQPMLGSAILP
ncbi:ABC transporter substrate-binding protein [Variovorax sp. J22P168]|uniref:ABC transporter substrate-binding protein n=1 Tax=Variovorax jilinensis TaxID=3053513 RepID=UPI0025783677|nr:ABC transporter substrate-binding protein [Variovorax sp. J22P168]MDM0012102.1 ABC transporter substrate-binding protein [Variovorax sp. J22P168]